MKKYEIKKYPIDSNRIDRALEEISDSINATISNKSNEWICEIISTQLFTISEENYILVTFSYSKNNSSSK
jgi:hypothetical protein